MSHFLASTNIVDLNLTAIGNPKYSQYSFINSQSASLHVTRTALFLNNNSPPYSALIVHCKQV
uniref:Uncharacterized protein n=1 Tax=uncultured marine virus TaxID=186617 RepID=A0A0F7L3M7_9VIRU|nr:hypothetical protein [uncultured marine virus]